jgi:hypothetical protein
VAIKGKTKRSQGRPARRITPGPRPQAVERRIPWYRQPVLMVAVAVAVVLITLVATVLRVQEGWRRDDVERFTAAIKAPLDKVTAISGSGSASKPGFASAADLASKKLKAAELDRRAQNWNTELGAIQSELNAVTVGEAPTEVTDGVPSNEVGGRVALLTGVRDTYSAGIGEMTEAATLFSAAGKAKTAAEQQAGVASAQAVAARAQKTMDTAAAQLAIIRAGNGLAVTAQLPGESSTGYSARYSSAPAGTQDPTGGVPGLPTGPSSGGVPATIPGG